jgi:hypothetical protein
VLGTTQGGSAQATPSAMIPWLSTVVKHPKEEAADQAFLLKPLGRNL